MQLWLCWHQHLKPQSSPVKNIVMSLEISLTGESQTVSASPSHSCHFGSPGGSPRWFATSELVLQHDLALLPSFWMPLVLKTEQLLLGSLQSRPLSSHPPKDGETFSRFLPAPAGLPARGFDFQGAVASEGWQRIWGRPSTVTQRDCPWVPKSWVLIR